MCSPDNKLPAGRILGILLKHLPVQTLAIKIKFYGIQGLRLQL